MAFDKTVKVSSDLFNLLKTLFTRGKVSGEKFELDLTNVRSFTPDWKNQKIKIIPPAPIVIKLAIPIKTTISELVFKEGYLFVEVDNSFVDLRVEEDR